MTMMELAISVLIGLFVVAGAGIIIGQVLHWGKTYAHKETQPYDRNAFKSDCLNPDMPIESVLEKCGGEAPPKTNITFSSSSFATQQDPVERDYAIHVPGGVILEGGGYTKETKTLSFDEWLETALNQYMPLGRDYKGAYQAMLIRQAIVRGKYNEIVLPSECYDVVKRAVTSAQWNPAFSHLFIQFFNAVNYPTRVEAR